MKIKTQILLVQNRYRVVVDVYEPTAAESEALAAFGEPLVQCGGDFEGTLTRPGDEYETEVDYTLPAEERRLVSDFPLTRIFDLGDDLGSDLKAKLYQTVMTTRIETAVAVLRAQEQPFVGETVTTI